MELLKIYALHRFEESRHSSPIHVAGDPISPSEACTVMNAQWVLPWMWQRKDIDLDFVRLVTAACIRVSGSEDGGVSPISNAVDSHAESVYGIFQVSN
jgi:hypothetical protein